MADQDITLFSYFKWGGFKFRTVQILWTGFCITVTGKSVEQDPSAEPVEITVDSNRVIWIGGNP